jgi:hypothetical protein
MLELRRAGRRSRPVTGGKRHSFIEKEQLGPAAPAHQLPAASLIVEDTTSRALVVQRLPSSVLVAGSWMIPRLPV